MSNFSINQGVLSGNISGFYNESRERSNIPVPVIKESGESRLSFSVCHNTSRKGSNGEWVEQPHFFEFTVFGRTALYLADNLVLGQGVTISYRLKQDSWEQDGNKRSKVAFVVESVVPGSLPKGKSNGVAPAPVPVTNPDLIPF
jgi:single-strand DNA-binding protein